MTTAIYIIWCAIPLFFFLMALWSFLEKTAGKKKHERPDDLLKQGLFVSICVALCFLIDKYILPGIVETLVQDQIPYVLFQVVLLPVIFYLAARIIGPSKAIQIARPPEIKRRR